MIAPHNYNIIAWELEDLLETPVSEKLVELIPEEDRIRFIQLNSKHSIGAMNKEDFINICKGYLDKASMEYKKNNKYKPKNDVEALYLSQKLNK